MQTSQEQAYKRTETQWSETAEHLKVFQQCRVGSKCLKRETIHSRQRHQSDFNITTSTFGAFWVQKVQNLNLRSPAAKWFRNSAGLDAGTPRRRAPEHRDGLNNGSAVSSHQHDQEIQTIPNKTMT